MSRFGTSKTNLLKDNSWIKKDDDEDEDVDRDPNFGKSILSNFKTGETIPSEESEEVSSTRTITTSTSVQSLSQRFSGSQDDLNGSTLPTKTSYTKSSYSSLKSPTTTTTTTVTKDGKTTETTVTTTDSLKSPVVKSPTQTFSERVLNASNKGQQYTPYSPVKSTKPMETSPITNKDAEDKLYDRLIPKAILEDKSPTDSKKTITTTETVVKSNPDTESAENHLFESLTPSSTRDDYSTTERTTISSTETVTVRSSINGDVKTSTTTRTSSTPEDDLYSTLLPRAITSGLDSPKSSSSITRREVITVESSREVESPVLSSPSSTRRTTSYSSYVDDLPSTRTSSYTYSSKSSDDYDPDRKSYSFSRPDSSYEYSSLSSPSSYTSTTYRSRSEDNLSDPIYSKSSKSLYSSDRTVLEKDLCTVCRKPFTGDAKMVLEDVRINCHATCFKCQVCNNTLSFLKAGDSLWVYKQLVHCESCFDNTRDSWRR